MTQRGLAYFIGEGATRALFALLLFAFASAASAGRVLVIYGPIFGPADFAVPLQAAGHTVDASNTVPASLDQYDQVWDVRLTGTGPVRNRHYRVSARAVRRLSWQAARRCSLSGITALQDRAIRR